MSKFMARNSQEKYDEDLITEKAWEEMDRDGNQEVSKEEFVRAVMAQDKFSKLITQNVVGLLSVVDN